MNQWNRELLALTAQQWVNAMNTIGNFSAEIRSKDAVDKHADQDLSAFNDGMGSSTQRVEKALSCIAARGYLGKDMQALDIGSGNGVFTLPFAEQYKKVTSLDISSAMQGEIRRKAAEKGITNIEYAQQMLADFLSRREYFTYHYVKKFPTCIKKQSRMIQSVHPGLFALFL